MTTLAAITTNAGRAKILNQDQQGLSVRITHLAVGSAGYTPVATQTALQAEQERVLIADSRENPEQSRLDLSAVVNSALEYWVREIGLYDEDGVLVFLWSAPQASLSLGYKSANVDFLLGLSLSLADLPADAITIVDQGYDLELWIRPIEEDMAGEHPAGAQHHYAATNWRETDWINDSMAWEVQAEQWRMHGQSGVLVSRAYLESGSEPFNRPLDGSYSTLNIHNHPNYRAMAGIAEFAAAVNGYYVRTRHNDYRLQSAAAGAYLATSDVAGPVVPPSVSGSVSAQTAEMREYLRAFAAADPTIRDYRDHFRLTLSALEVWPEILPTDRSVTETYLSFRHLEIASELREQYARALEHFASGFKPRFENLSIIPGSIRQVSVAGRPALVAWRYRIICADIGSVRDWPLAQLMEPQDRLAARWHWGQNETVADAYSSRQSRYRINSKLTAEPSDGRETAPPRLLDTIMALLPGLNGPGANLSEIHGSDDPANPTATSTAYIYGTSAPLNAAYYNRAYGYSAGASNRSNTHRGFNDPTLFAALNTRPEVHAVEQGGRSYRYSYAVPLEIIVRTPLESWNPHALPIVADDAPVTGSGTVGSPYTAARANGRWYLTPTELYTGAAGAPDPADTDPGAVYVRDAGGTARATRSSGLYIHLPPIAGITPDIRLRYPIYPLYHEGSPVWAMAQAALGDMSRAHLAAMSQLAALHDRVASIEAGAVANAAQLSRIYKQGLSS